MTENLLQQVEEKVMTLLTELDAMRDELNALKYENSTLHSEKVTSTKKLQYLVSLLDAVNATQPLMPPTLETLE